MRTKEEILHDEYGRLISNPDKVYVQNPSIIKAAHTAMDEWGKEMAIGFAEWLRQNYFKPVDLSDKPMWIQFGSKIGWLQPGMSIVRTTDHLFGIYLESLNP